MPIARLRGRSRARGFTRLRPFAFHRTARAGYGCVVGFVQRFGAALAIARRALAENGKPPPEFVLGRGYVSATVRTARPNGGSGGSGTQFSGVR